MFLFLKISRKIDKHEANFTVNIADIIERRYSEITLPIATTI